MKYLTKIFFGILIFAGFTLTGCMDLSETPVSDITADEHFSDAEGLEDALLGAYRRLRYYHSGRRGNDSNGDYMNNLGTDIWQVGLSGPGSRFNSYNSGLGISPEERRVEETWIILYQGINNANAVISRADGIDMSDDLKQQIIAEARFLRAHYYYQLVIHYGAVHLTLEETIGVETEANRAPEEEIWQAIFNDLEFAEQHLPEEQDDWGRVTLNAARHHLILAHLWQENWEEAANYAITVIESGQYSLLDNFSDVFDINNQQNDEIIFSVQYTTDQSYNTPGNWQHLGYTMRYDNLPGMHRNLEDGRPWSRIMPTTFLMTEIFKNDYREGGLHIKNDVRYYESFREVYYYTDPEGIPYEEASVGDTSAYVTTDPYVQEWSEEEKDEKTYVVLTIDDWEGQWYPSLKRVADPHRASVNEPQGTRDVFVMRLAETYLLAAEALFMAGRPDEAVEYFNEVRKRAEAPGETIPLMTAAELNIDEILDERARELAGELHRWPTLKRTGKLLERVRAHNPKAADYIQERDLLRPIPQIQIDRTTNEYEQNPGY